MNALGARLREERQRLALNQTAFAAECGVRKLAQLKYENGERAPNADYLVAAAQHGVDVQYVLTGVRYSDATAPQIPAAELARLTREVETLRHQLDHSEDVAAYWYGEAERMERLYHEQRRQARLFGCGRRQRAGVEL